MVQSSAKLVETVSQPCIFFDILLLSSRVTCLWSLFFLANRCPQTLLNYFTKAKYPDRLSIGVVQQNDHGDVDCVAEYCKLKNGSGEGPECPYFDNIRTVRVEAKLATGPCYGRHLQVNIGGAAEGQGGGRGIRAGVAVV